METGRDEPVASGPSAEVRGRGSRDPFSVLGLEATFALDLEALDARHRELSRVLHPDRHTGESARQRRDVLGRAIEVNEAWRVLREPVTRAEALLRRRGLHLDERREPPVAPEFLMEMMEEREALAAARAAKDPAALDALRGRVEARRSACLSRLTAAFDTETDERSAKRLLGELRFWRRLEDELGAVEDELL